MLKTIRKKGVLLFFSIFIAVITVWAITSMCNPTPVYPITALVQSNESLTIDYIYEANTVVLKFPLNQPAPVGKVLFHHSTDVKQNRTFDLKTDPSKQMFILLTDFEKGKWRVVVEWQGEDKIYSQEAFIAVESNDWARPVH